MSHMDAEPWIKQRLDLRGVFEEGGKWRADLRGKDVGSFASKKEALKAYRQAALEKFGDLAALPTVDEIDAAADKVEASAPQGSPQTPVSASGGAESPPTPQTPPSEPPKPAARPSAHAPPHKGRR